MQGPILTQDKTTPLPRPYVYDLNQQAPPLGGFPQGLLLDGHTPRAQALASENNPNLLTDGTLSMFVIHRGDRYALCLKDFILLRGFISTDSGGMHRMRNTGLPPDGSPMLLQRL
jgi:hypothetical protein